MTDREMLKLCADAMDISVQLLSPETGFPSDDHYVIPAMCAGSNPTYDPLNDDAQAMALVKKFCIGIDPMAERSCGWMVTYYGDDDERIGVRLHNPNLNRAIVECVAKMQADRLE